MANPGQIIPLIVAHANYYGISLGDDVVEMYAADLANYPIQDLQAAYVAYRNNPRNSRNPLPSQIKSILNPEIDTRGAATELASRISSAVQSRDSYWVQYGGFKAEFLNSLGEVAWNVVQKRGGWPRLCEQYWGQDHGQFLAQLRDLIEFTWTSSSSGNLLPMHELPKLDHQTQNFEQIGSIARTTLTPISGGKGIKP